MRSAWNRLSDALHDNHRLKGDLRRKDGDYWEMIEQQHTVEGDWKKTDDNMNAAAVTLEKANSKLRKKLKEKLTTEDLGWRSHGYYVVEYERRKHRDKLAKFREDAAINITQAAQWGLEDVLVVEAMAYDMSWLGDEALWMFGEREEVEEALQRLDMRCVAELMGDGFGGPGTPPWAHNSTNAISNMGNVAKASSWRHFHHLVNSIKSRIEHYEKG